MATPNGALKVQYCPSQGHNTCLFILPSQQSYHYAHFRSEVTEAQKDQELAQGSTINCRTGILQAQAINSWHTPAAHNTGLAHDHYSAGLVPLLQEGPLTAESNLKWKVRPPSTAGACRGTGSSASQLLDTGIFHLRPKEGKLLPLTHSPGVQGGAGLLTEFASWEWASPSSSHTINIKFL